MLTIADMTRLSGESRRTIQNLCDKEVLHPSWHHSLELKTRRYAVRELEIARILAPLFKLNVEHSLLAPIAELFRSSVLSDEGFPELYELAAPAVAAAREGRPSKAAIQVLSGAEHPINLLFPSPGATLEAKIDFALREAPSAPIIIIDLTRALSAELPTKPRAAEWEEEGE